jgi:fluoride exporter
VSVAAWTAAAVLGGAGAVFRFLVDGTVSTWIPRDFPYGTLVVNLMGAFLLGVVDGLALSSTSTALLGAAAVGGYTTFSTWMLESQRLAEEGELPRALSNVTVSLVLGLLAAFVGRELGMGL